MPLRFAVLGGCAVLLWLAVDWHEAFGLLRRADAGWLILAVILLTVQTILSAQRWRITAAQLGIVIGPMAALREYYLSQVVNLSLPGGVAGDVGRAVRTRDQAGLGASGQSVLFERLAGQLGLLALLALGLAITLAFPGTQNWPDWLIAPVTFGVVTATAFVVAGYLSIRFLGRVAEPLRRATATFRTAIVDRSVWRQQAVLSLGTALCNVAAFACCAAALGVSLSMLATLTLVPLILFAMVLPLSVGGWGLREGAAAVLFPAIGATMGEGLATSIAFGLVILASTLPGVFIGWTHAEQRQNDPRIADGLQRRVER